MHMRIKLDILVYKYKELGDIVTFCDENKNQAVEICYIDLVFVI